MSSKMSATSAEPMWSVRVAGDEVPGFVGVPFRPVEKVFEGAWRAVPEIVGQLPRVLLRDVREQSTDVVPRNKKIGEFKRS